jgi:hypothetical protein
MKWLLSFHVGNCEAFFCIVGRSDEVLGVKALFLLPHIKLPPFLIVFFLYVKKPLELMQGFEALS